MKKVEILAALLANEYVVKKFNPKEIVKLTDDLSNQMIKHKSSEWLVWLALLSNSKAFAAYSTEQLTLAAKQFVQALGKIQ